MRTDLTDEVVAGLSPGIRKTVLWLHNLGFDTTDSGDGSNYKAGMECAMPYPHVCIVAPPSELASACDRLRGFLSAKGVDVQPIGPDPDDLQPFIQGTYDPANGVAIIDLHGVNDAMLFPEVAP